MIDASTHYKNSLTWKREKWQLISNSKLPIAQVPWYFTVTTSFSETDSTIYSWIYRKYQPMKKKLSGRDTTLKEHQDHLNKQFRGAYTHWMNKEVSTTSYSDRTARAWSYNFTIRKMTASSTKWLKTCTFITINCLKWSIWMQVWGIILSRCTQRINSTKLLKKEAKGWPRGDTIHYLETLVGIRETITHKYKIYCSGTKTWELI